MLVDAIMRPRRSITCATRGAHRQAMRPQLTAHRDDSAALAAYFFMGSDFSEGLSEEAGASSISLTSRRPLLAVSSD